MIFRGLKYIFVGIMFGIILTKTEAASWYRIFEMFRFESFHMYGLIGMAIGCGLIVTTFIKKKQLKDFRGNEIIIPPKAKNYKSALLGGIIFGLGWALTGACPGPAYSLVGYGYTEFLVILLSALFGTFVYGVLRPRLPH